MRRTVEQEAVIVTVASKFAVKAAAGSGKTSVLVERYIRHVTELGHTPEELVTVTFTRKAAAEMKARIVAELRKLGRYEDAQLAETGPIQTLHSFCERVLRENSVEALLDPNFEVLEGHKSVSLVETAVRTALLAARDENEHAAALVDRLSGRGAAQASASAHGQLRVLVANCLHKLRGTGLPREWLSETYATPESTLGFWFASVLSEFPETVGHGLLPDSDWGSELSKRLREGGVRVPHWAKGQSLASDLAAAKDSVGLMWLVLTAWDWLESEMLRVQELDFPLLESKAVRLLSESPVVKKRIMSSIKALLVDEAQDLNPMQYKLINSIQASGEMLVGDPQQSIYGFRYADRELFVERCLQVETYQLSRNHRSDLGILHFVDSVFAPQWGSEHTSMVPSLVDPDDPFGSLLLPHYQGVELWPVPQRDFGTTAALIKQLVDEGVEPSKIAVLTRTSAAINQLTPKLTTLGVPNRSVGASEKFYTRLEVRDLANALEALCDPRGDFALLALLRSPFVGLSFDAVVWLAAHTPVLVGIADDTRLSNEDKAKLETFRVWFERGRRIADRVPAWETISYLLSNTGYLEELAKRPSADQALANVRKLLALAADEPESNAREFAQRIREIQFLRHGEGEAPVLDESEEAVTLMTIHKSKGLEFDVVVLPDTYYKLSPQKGQVAFDAPKGVMVTGLDKPLSAYYSWLADKEVEQGREEELRVLYVAMTRAKTRLCLVVSEQGGHANAAEIIALRTGYPKSTLPGLKVRRLSESPE